MLHSICVITMTTPVTYINRSIMQAKQDFACHHSLKSSTCLRSHSFIHNLPNFDSKGLKHKTNDSLTNVITFSFFVSSMWTWTPHVTSSFLASPPSAASSCPHGFTPIQASLTQVMFTRTCYSRRAGGVVLPLLCVQITLERWRWFRQPKLLRSWCSQIPQAQMANTRFPLVLKLPLWRCDGGVWTAHILLRLSLFGCLALNL